MVPCSTTGWMGLERNVFEAGQDAVDGAVPGNDDDAEPSFGEDLRQARPRATIVEVKVDEHEVGRGEAGEVMRLVEGGGRPAGDGAAFHHDGLEFEGEDRIVLTDQHPQRLHGGDRLAKTAGCGHEDFSCTGGAAWRLDAMNHGSESSLMLGPAATAGRARTPLARRTG